MKPVFKDMEIVARPQLLPPQIGEWIRPEGPRRYKIVYSNRFPEPRLKLRRAPVHEAA